MRRPKAALLFFGPMIWAIELSFTSYDMVSTPTFVGLDNYRKLAGDPVFLASLANWDFAAANFAA